ncbi:alpha/beta hydrolase [Burkholderiaceae bacterium UC74_6]
MPSDNCYIACARNIKSNQFGDEPGDITFLEIGNLETDYGPGNKIASAQWRDAVVDAADSGVLNEITGKSGNVLLFLHGYNTDTATVLWKTRELQSSLTQAGWRGVVIAFDWPSDNSTLNYLEDRHDAATVAGKIVTQLLPLLLTKPRRTSTGKVREPDPSCTVDIHMLCHSTGAYVALEAFAQTAKEGSIFKSDWRLAQVAFISGDVASTTLSTGDAWARPMMDRIVRLTNYSNGHDAVLGVSNAKRLGTSPRAGRTGAANPIDPKVVNVDCTRYFESIDPKAATFRGTFCHSWQVGDPTFALDLAMTLEAFSSRDALPTRSGTGSQLELKTSQRPEFSALWDAASSAEAAAAG